MSLPKLFRSHKFLVILCVLSILSACVPAVIGIYQLAYVHDGIKKIDRTSNVSTQARNVLENVSHSLPVFIAIALKLPRDERARILVETDQQLTKLKLSLKALLSLTTDFISEQQRKTLTGTINSVAESWQDIREKAGSDAEPAELTFHFLKLVGEIKDIRTIITAIESKAENAAEIATRSSFNHIQRASLLLIWVILAAAFMTMLAILGSFRVARATHKANVELRESERRFKTLVESTNVVPWEFKPQTMRFTYVGPQAVELFGYKIEDWYSEGFWENIIHPEDQETTIAICKQSVQRCEDHDFEYRIITADGGYIWVHDVSSVINEDSQRMMFRGVFINITAKKNSEANLRESEQRFKDIVDISSDWIWECDENLRFTCLSDRFEQVAGLSKEKILGKTLHDISTDTEADWNTHLADLEARRSFRMFNYSAKDENGKICHWSISGLPIFDVDGNFKGYRGTGSNRTAKVQAEAELVRHRDNLQELVNTATQEIKVQAVELCEALAKEKKLNKLQREFVSMASHEFRTPLAIIDATAQRMKSRASKNKLTPEDALQRIEKIRCAVRRMTRLMESTLTAARMQEGKIDIMIEPCNIGKVVQDVCMRQQEVAQSHTITCELAEIPSAIQADLGSLDQIFTNLLSNAVKYAPDVPDIHVQVRSEGDHVVISVRDHGIGIDEDEISKIGERYFRAKSSTGTAGTGIGLNLVKTLLEMHGGSISIQSKLGDGSTFTVCLPIAGPSKAEQAA